MGTNGIPLTRRQFGGRVAGVAAAVSGPACLSAAGTRPHALLAGAAQTVVTPPAQGTFLIGPLKPSTGVHDDLFARALVLDSGHKQVAIITLDYLGFDIAYNELLLAAVARASGIPAGHILINCSHTHNAPLTAPWGPWEKKKDKPFHHFLPVRLAGIVKEAVARLRPARLRYRREPTQIGFNRRCPRRDHVVMAPNPRGAVLPWVDVLAVEGQDGKPIAVLFSHAAHPVIVHATSTLISADYPGAAVRTLQNSRRSEGIYLFGQGCGGNINAFPLRGGIEAAAAAGRELGLAVNRALDAPAEALANPALEVCSLELRLPLLPPPVARIKEMQANEKNAEAREWLAELLAIAQSGKPQTLPLPIRGIALGAGFCLLGMAHEIFAEYHLHVDRVSPFPRNMVLAYTNGDESYIGTQKDYDLGERGGYEASPFGAALKYQRRLALAPGGERQIKEGIESLLNKLKGTKSAGRLGKRG